MIVGNLYSECLSKEALDGLGDLNIGGGGKLFKL